MHWKQMKLPNLRTHGINSSMITRPEGIITTYDKNQTVKIQISTVFEKKASYNFFSQQFVVIANKEYK